MASCGGVEYEDFTNIKKNTRVSTLGNDASENMQVNMRAGSWTSVRKVDFGTGAKSFTLRAKGTGTLEIRFSRPARPAATIEFSSTDMEDHTIVLDDTKFKGVKNNVYFVVTAAENVYVDAWQFSEEDISGIKEVRQSAPAINGTYNLGGRRLQETNTTHGIVIENGKKVSR